ncbi:Avr9/Cf-9 rapidly elicited protein [Populus alba x Populus x berolinensis]|nr:Avr9/Cf-9 rapidly elicited protein [Populus alba x Populus x berolinensis]
MNSMFSSFDALCNEFLSQKVKSSFTFTTMDGNTRRVLSSKVAEDKLIKKQQGSSSRSLTRKQEKKMPRFAPELDGLNCFETIVNY